MDRIFGISQRIVGVGHDAVMTEAAKAFAFLFNSSDPSAPSLYGARFDSAFLGALQKSDPEGQVHSWLLRGDLMLSHLAGRVTSVEQNERGRFHTLGFDHATLATLIFDFVDWVSRPPSRFDVQRLKGAILRMDVAHSITAISMPVSIVQAVDDLLQVDPLYLGAAAIDLGNPVMKQLLVDLLIRDAGISKGRVWLEADHTGDVHTLFSGAETFGSHGLGILPLGGLFDTFGDYPAADMSELGEVAVLRFEGKSRLTLQQKIVALLARQYNIPDDKPFRFDAIDSSVIFESAISPAKLTEYALTVC